MRVCSLCHRCYEIEVVSCIEADHPPLSETRYGSPEMIAGYRLDYLLESGVAGDVYCASQTASGRSCRITILSTDSQKGQQFLDEAKLAVALFHPNVVDVYEAGSLESGEVFVVAEDPDGESLRDLLNNVGVPHLLISIQVVRQTAEALHVLHQKGFTHRAVNPENIVLTTDSEHRLLVRIKDLDFGGVVEQAIVSNKFFIDSAINSLKYFAAEQCSGEPVSMKTDVYSLGIVLYEMLAGVPPFDAEKAAALIDKHKNQRPPEIKIDNFELRMLLTHSLMESLHKRPDRRQSSANAFARQLRHIEQLATHVSTPPPAGIVPPAPHRTAVAFTTSTMASALPGVIQSAAVMEPRKVTYIENTQPLTAAIENEPVSIFEVERDSHFAAFQDESEAIAIIEASGSANDRVADPDLSSADPATENFTPVIEHFVKEEIAHPVSRLSRLRMRMKKLHPRTAPPLPEIPEHRYIPAAESLPLAPVPVIAEPAAETAFYQAEPASAPMHLDLAKIECEQPENDIPSVAEVLEVVSKKQIPEIPVIRAAPEKIAAPPIQDLPPRIEWEQPKAVVVEALSKQRKAEIPVFHNEPEEITLVSAPGRRIRVEWDQPSVPQNFLSVGRLSTRASHEVSFFPTILGDTGKGKTVDLDQGDSMFSAYYPSSRSRFSIPYRSLMIGGGFMALIVVFLFGDDLVGRYASMGSSGDSVETKATLAKENPAPDRKPDGVTRAKRKAVKSFKQPVPESTDSVNREQNKLSKTQAVNRSAGKLPDNGKMKPKPEPAKNSADKKTLSSLNKAANSTRPRFVKDPKP